ncbi:MAG: hypothetical protein K2I72_02600 [Bacilli bacterium]|nr:hypothetical protein [Bacilli bacterium]
MYVYRAMSSEELLNRMKGIETNRSIVLGVNSFQYEEGHDYIHFFKFLSHALFFQKIKHLAVVAKLEISDEIIPPLEYGIYGGVDTYYDDALYGWYIPLPEIIIERNLVNNDCFVEFMNLNTIDYEEEQENLPTSFWVEREIEESKKRNMKEIISSILKQSNDPKSTEKQFWNSSSIYYEYLKSLMEKFDWNENTLLRYLKTIDLDQELNSMK